MPGVALFRPWPSLAYGVSPASIGESLAVDPLTVLPARTVRREQEC